VVVQSGLDTEYLFWPVDCLRKHLNPLERFLIILMIHILTLIKSSRFFNNSLTD